MDKDGHDFEMENHRKRTSITIEGKPLILIMIALLGGGSFGAFQSATLATDPQARPDAWTKTDAIASRKEVEAKIEEWRADSNKVHARQLEILDRYEHRLDELDKCRERVEAHLRQISRFMAKHNR